MIAESMKLLCREYPAVKAVVYPAILFRRWLRRKRYSSTEKLLSGLSELLVDDPIVKVAEFQGVFAVSVRSHLLSRLIVQKEYESREAGLCLKYLNPNLDVIDIGANVGFYSVLCAKNISRQRVLAVEPASNAVRRLRRNIQLNCVADKVEVFEGIISDRNGMCEIKVVEDKEEYSSIGSMAHPGIGNSRWIIEQVESITLDRLIEQKSLEPGFIKLDVEGVEHLVLKGAKKVLAVTRPVILSELDDYLLRQNGSSAGEVVRLIAGYEYDVVDTNTMSIVKKLDEMKYILCLPKELGGPINRDG